MSTMVPSTPSYSNTDYMQNLLRMQQQQQQPRTLSTQPADTQPNRNTRGGGGSGHNNKRHRHSDDSTADRAAHSNNRRGGGGRGDRQGGGGGGRGGWRGGRGRGRGGRGGGGGGGGEGGGDSWDRGHGVMDNPQYDFETGQIDPSYPANWDSDCTLVALMPRHNQPAQPAETDSNEVDAKRQKADKDESIVSEAEQDSGSGGWRDYRPYIVSTFTFDTTSPPLLRDATRLASRIEVPGTPAVWKQPTLPLHIKVKKERGSGQQVNKPPLSVLMHVANKAGCLVDGQPLPHPTAPADSSLTFVAYRNSLRSLLDARKPTWRIDVQRVGRVVLLRRHLDYAWEEGEDVGHQFERLCTEPADSGEDEKRGWRGLIAGCVGKHMLLTSSEIDAVKRDDGDSTDLAAHSRWELRQLVELKTAWKSLAAGKLKEKLKSYWLQSWLGGVPAIQLGLKSNAAGGSADVVIDELRQVEVSGMASDEWKDGCMQRLRRMLTWLADVVQEGAVYKLVRERKDGSGEWQVALYKVVGGKDTWPIWAEQQRADEPTAATAASTS